MNNRFMLALLAAILAAIVVIGCATPPAGGYTDQQIDATATAQRAGILGLSQDLTPLATLTPTSTPGLNEDQAAAAFTQTAQAELDDLSLEDWAATFTAQAPTQTPVTPAPTATPVVTEGAAPTSQPTPTAMPADFDPALICDGELFSVTGVPNTVQLSDYQLAKLVKPEEMANRPPSENWNSIDMNAGINSRSLVSDAGVYLTHDLADAENNESAWLISDDTQYMLDQAGESYGNLCEGCFLWVAADALIMETNGVRMCAASRPSHSWIVAMSNPRWDHQIDTDLNLKVKIWAYNPGFTVVSRFPPGSYLSQKYVLDNLASCHTAKTTGSDGSSTCDFLIADVIGGGWTGFSHFVDGSLSPLGTNFVP